MYFKLCVMTIQSMGWVLFPFSMVLWPGPWQTMFCGGIGGLCLWLSIFPADLIKSRAQISYGEELKFIPTLLGIIRNEGELPGDQCHLKCNNASTPIWPSNRSFGMLYISTSTATFILWMNCITLSLQECLLCVCSHICMNIPPTI